MGRLRPIAYAIEPNPNQSAVAVYAVVVALAGGYVTLALGVLLLAGDHTRWGWVGAGVGISVAQGLLVSRELRGLLSEPFTPTPPLRTVAYLWLSTATVATIGYGVASDDLVWFSWPALFMPVTVAATVGNASMLTAALAGSSLALAVAAGQAGYSGQAVAAALLTFSGGALAGAWVLRDIRAAGLKAATRFERLAETSEVILRAEGLDHALERFLPLLADQLSATRVEAWACTGDGLVLPRRTWPDGVRPGDPPPDLGPAAIGSAEVDGRTYVWASHQDGSRLVLVVDAPPPVRRWRVGFHNTVRRLTGELGLLVQHTDFVVRLEELSRTDVLTGLPNRLQLHSSVSRECAAARRGGEPLSLAMVDLDHFKSYNDTFGHQEGDAALVAVAHLLRERLRETDYACRYGGEEFCLVLPGTPAEGAGALLDDLRERVEELPTRRRLSFSAGVAAWDGSESPDRLLKRADDALYAAKAAGRARTELAG